MALIHRWPLTTDATDVVGGLATTNKGGITFDAANGASFNGSNQWLSFVKNLSSMSFTISAWAKFGTITGVNRALFFSASSAGIAPVTGMLYAGAMVASAYYAASSFNSGSSEVTAANYPTDTFVLCSLSYDSSTGSLKMYRGTNQIATGTVTAGTINTNWSIGRYGAYAGLYFLGNVLDARIYDTALSASDVAALYAAGPNGASSAKYFPQCI